MPLLVHILLMILIVILGMLLLVLIMPIIYQFNMSYSSEEGFKAQAHLWKILSFTMEKTDEKWQGVIGIAGKKFTPGSRQSKKTSRIKRRKAKPASQKTSPPFWKTLPLLTDKAFLQESLTLFKDVLGMIRPRFFRMEGSVGFDEPHHTAWALTLVASLNGICNQQVIHLEPVWDEETVDIHLSFGGCFMILMILTRFLAYLLSKEFRSWRKEWKAIKQTGTPSMQNKAKHKNSRGVPS